jgi:NTP pyrophosphatase (non-canonical NTP hydrolase)
MGYPIQSDDPNAVIAIVRGALEDSARLRIAAPLVDSLRAVNTRLRGDNEQLRVDNDRLRAENERLRRDVSTISSGQLRLSFFALREANLARLPLFKNAQGRPAHPVDGSLPHGFDWSLTDWMTAVAGETGELANVVKKVRRGDMTMNEARAKLAQEAADIVIYLDLFAYRAGFRLDLAVQDTWNNKSRELDLGVRLNHNGCVVVPKAATPAARDNGFDPDGG